MGKAGSQRPAGRRRTVVAARARGAGALASSCRRVFDLSGGCLTVLSNAIATYRLSHCVYQGAAYANAGGGSDLRASSSSRSLWAATAAPGPHLQKLSGDLRAHVTIIGGGYTAHAMALREPGRSICGAWRIGC
jgi:hypothetical protein